jgi:hypothetical protein
MLRQLIAHSIFLSDGVYAGRGITVDMQGKLMESFGIYNHRLPEGEALRLF